MGLGTVFSSLLHMAKLRISIDTWARSALRFVM